MSLWGNKDNIGVGTTGLVSLDYGTLVVTGTGTSFGLPGYAQTGDVIRFGSRLGTYFGDAVIVDIDSTTQLTVGSTAMLSGAAIASTTYTINQEPKYVTLDSQYSETRTNADTFVYGISTAGAQSALVSQYAVPHAGWVGIMTYNDNEGNLRVKSEVLVAMSGIATGNVPQFPGQK
jgi:hypothetical protein